MWGSVKALARGYDYMMGIAIFTPVAVLAWFPFVTEFQSRLLFNQAFSRGLQIQIILAGGKKNNQFGAFFFDLLTLTVNLVGDTHRYINAQVTILFTCCLFVHGAIKINLNLQSFCIVFRPNSEALHYPGKGYILVSFPFSVQW